MRTALRLVHRAHRALPELAGDAVTAGVGLSDLEEHSQAGRYHVTRATAPRPRVSAGS